MTQTTITCILCERQVPPDEVARSHRPRYFDDVVICPTCLDGERHGHGDNAAAVRRCLEARRDGERTTRQPTTAGG